MLNGFNRTVLAVTYLVLFVVGVVGAWSAINSDFRNRLVGAAKPYLLQLIDSQADTEALKQAIVQEQQKASSLEQEIAEMKQQLASLKLDLEQASSEVEQERSRLKDEFDRLQQELDKEVSSREIAIEQVKDKFTVIRVGDQILFDSGSSQLKPRGREVLSLIAATLGKFPGRQVRVEGHTDNKPIVNARTKSRYPTNWELSSARATAAVRYLIDNGGLDPKRVIAAGLGEHHPIDSNETSEGRARNRRIEIVLMPAQDDYQVQQVKGL